MSNVKLRKSFSIGLLGLVLTLMTACGTTVSVGTDVSCRAFRVIEWSQQDTPPTIKQVKEHNAVYGELCP